jgi:hypothetical protein
VLAFGDGTLVRAYLLQVAIAKPSTSAESLPSVIGRPLLNKWRMRHDPWDNRLEVIAKDADLTIRSDMDDVAFRF